MMQLLFSQVMGPIVFGGSSIKEIWPRQGNIELVVIKVHKGIKGYNILVLVASWVASANEERGRGSLLSLYRLSVAHNFQFVLLTL